MFMKNRPNYPAVPASEDFVSPLSLQYRSLTDVVVPGGSSKAIRVFDSGSNRKIIAWLMSDLLLSGLRSP